MIKRVKRSQIWKIPKKELEKIVCQSKTFREVLLCFGLSNKGGNFKTLKSRLLEDQIDFTYLTNNKKKWDFTREKRRCIPLDEILTKDSNYNRCHLKKRIISEGLLKNECSKCGCSPFWCEQPLVMVLDHINGVANDNRIENLQLLCPNCNSQTSTFAGRSLRKIKNCIDCGKLINHKWKRCGKCSSIQPKISIRKVDRPNAAKLNELLWSKPTTEIAKSYGVTDKSIEKWAKSYGLTKPPRGYWQKQIKKSMDL